MEIAPTDLRVKGRASHQIYSLGFSRGVSDVMLMYLLNERNQLG